MYDTKTAPSVTATNSKEAAMGYLQHCENCGSASVAASFGPLGFRVLCRQCGAVRELDDNFEPVDPSPPASRVAAATVVR